MTFSYSHSVPPRDRAPGAVGLFGDTKRVRLMILALFLVHMIIGLLGWDFVITADGKEYLRLAQNILDQGSFTYDGVNLVVGKPPGFSFLIAAYLWLVGSLKGFHWLQLIFMYLAFVFIAGTMARWKGWAWGLAGLTVMVAAWPLHLLTSNLYAEAPFLALTSAGLYLVVRHAQSGRLWGNVLAGVLFGLSTYFRPVNLFWPFAIILFSLIWNRRYVRTTIIICAVHVLMVSPWLARNWYQFGRPVPMVANWGPLYFMTDADIWKQHFFEGSGVIRASDRYHQMLGGEFQFNWRPNVVFRRAALDNIREDPAGYVGRCIWQSAFAWTFVPGTKEAHKNAPILFNAGRVAMFGYYLLTILGAAGLMRARRPMAGLPALYAVYTALILVPVCTESRYLIPPYLWLLPYTLAGTGAVWHFIRDRQGKGEVGQ